jgi:hypothetical protein
VRVRGWPSCESARGTLPCAGCGPAGPVEEVPREGGRRPSLAPQWWRGKTGGERKRALARQTGRPWSVSISAA